MCVSSFARDDIRCDIGADPSLNCSFLFLPSALPPSARLPPLPGKGGFGKVNAIQRRSNNELQALKRMAKCEVILKESHVRMVSSESQLRISATDVRHASVRLVRLGFQR